MDSQLKQIWSWLDDFDLDLTPIFGGVSSDLLTKISADMVRFYHNGELIIRRGEQACSFAVLLHGGVCVKRNGVFLTHRSAPIVLGEQAYVNGTVHSADVEAQGLVKALVIPHTIVEELLNDPVFSRNLLREMSKKLRESTTDRAEKYRIQELLFDEFKAHTSPTILNRLLQQGQRYGDPRSINAIILFSDIRDFTPRSANLTPQELATQISTYFESVVGIIHEHDGLVDKYIGDAVMAIWGFAPEVEGRLDAAKVLRCAQKMVEVAATLPLGGRPIEIGVGLGSGEVFSGNVGSESKRQWTVLGEPVNLAARFESKSKELGTPIVAGQAFFDLLDAEHQGLFLGHPNQQVKGALNQTLYALDRKS
ncbi:MAG TPA: adenylate/guanylate cyclase domain-containing protein [Abditibacterium sp.]|jgi:class 3 adenylate cyclase